MALNELGLDDAQKKAILNALAAQPSTSTPSAEVTR